MKTLYGFLISIAFPLLGLAQIHSKTDTSKQRAAKIHTIDPDESVFQKVEMEAYYSGGDIAFKKCLEENVNQKIAEINKAPKGYHRTSVEISIDSNGRLLDIKPLSNAGYGMENEVVNALKKCSSWQPAVQNGRKVKSHKIIPFLFSVPAADNSLLHEPVFDKAEIEAAFPGGKESWKKFLESKLNFLVPYDNGAPEGQYTVMVQFIIEITGEISQIVAKTNHGYGMEEEVIRLIKSGPNWEPAVQNGRQVRSYKRIPVTFVVTEDDKVFEKVEIEDSFPGGEPAWRKFLEKNLNAAIPLNNGAPSGTYTVVIQFVVSKDGSLSDIKALTNHGYGMEKEVIRILKFSPKWEPAIAGGVPIKAYRKQPVTFQLVIDGEKPKKKKKKD
jgi:hypothetical protein